MTRFIDILHSLSPRFATHMSGHLFADMQSVLDALDVQGEKAEDAAQSAISLLSFDVNEISDMPDYMQRIGDLYILWRENEGESRIHFDGDIEDDLLPPSTTMLMASMLTHLGVSLDDKYGQAALVAAFLADMPSENPFHGNAHYRDITCTTFRILCAYDQLLEARKLDNAKYPKLSSKQKALLLCAAGVHDFCHDGKGNALEGVHNPMRLEQKSFDMASPILRELGLSEDELQQIRIMILTTDVSYGPQALSPSRILTRCYAHIYDGKDAPKIGVEDYKFLSEMLLADKELTLLAMMLEEADLFTSVGLSYEYAKMTTILVAEETKILSTKASTLHGFIEMICSGIMTTPSARLLFKPTFDIVYNHASLDVQKDKDYAKPTSKSA